MFGIRLSQREIRERLPSSIPFFLMSSKSLSPTLRGETPQPMAQYAHCPRLTGPFSFPMAEARDFQCCSHALENLGERSIPSDHAAVRVVIQKLTIRSNLGRRIPSCMSTHSVFCSILKQISDDHQYPDDPFAALADFKVIFEKARTTDCS